MSIGTITFKDVPILGSIFYVVLSVNIVIPNEKEGAASVDFFRYKCYRGNNERFYSEN